MTSLFLVGIILHVFGLAAASPISLELHAVEQPPAAPRKEGTGAALEDLAARSLKGSRSDVVEFSVVVRAFDSGDVYFNKSAVRLEIRDLSNVPLRYTCLDKREVEFRKDDYVRLRPRETMTMRLSASLACHNVNSGQKYAVVAVFEDGADPLRPPPPDGGTVVMRRVVSNRVVMKWPGPPKGRITSR